MRTNDIKNTFLHFLKQIGQLFFPPHCFYCKQFCVVNPYGLCNRCVSLINHITTITLAINSTTTLKVFSAGHYQGPLKMLILAKQYQHIYTCTALGELMWEKTDIQFQEFDIIVPIPLHWQRYAKRGYNQATEIANVLSKKMGIPVIELLKRQKATVFQLTLSKEERAQNVADVFVLAQKNYALTYKHKRILIVDDLLTTGSTLISASKVLMQLSPTTLNAVVGARVA